MSGSRGESLTWRKSSYSQGNGGNCVEVTAIAGGGMVIRDSKNASGPHLDIDRRGWYMFATALKSSLLSIPT